MHKLPDNSQAQASLLTITQADAAPFVVGQMRGVLPVVHGSERWPPSRLLSTFWAVSLRGSVNRGPVEQRLPDVALTGRAIAAGLPTFALRAPFGSRRGGGYGLLEHGARRLISLGGDGEHLGPAY
jgi:hypothetical protein